MKHGVQRMTEVLVLMAETSADGHSLRIYDEMMREEAARYEPSRCLCCGKVYLHRRRAVRA